MGKRTKQTFLQRRYTDGQLAHEKILSITSYYRNVHLTYNEVPSLTCSEWPSLTSPQIINAKEGVEKRVPSSTVGGNANWYNHYRKQYGVQSF